MIDITFEDFKNIQDEKEAKKVFKNLASNFCHQHALSRLWAVAVSLLLPTEHKVDSPGG